MKIQRAGNLKREFSSFLSLTITFYAFAVFIRGVRESFNLLKAIKNHFNS